MTQEQQRRPRHGKPHEGQVSDPIKQRIAEQEQRVAEQDDMAHALAEGVLAYDRKLTARIDAIERDLWRYDERLRIELKRYAPRASDWLSYLVVLLVGAVVANVFLLHMGELFGWGLTDRYNALLEPDRKVFIRGRVSSEEEKASKLICEQVWAFEDSPKDVWVQFETMQDYQAGWPGLSEILASGDGPDECVIYIRNPRSVKRLGIRYTFRAVEAALARLKEVFGEQNVKTVWRKK